MTTSAVQTGPRGPVFIRSIDVPGKNGSDIGGIFENMFKNDFNSVVKKRPCLVKKITDSKEAGNLIKSVPGDFEIRVPGTVKGQCFNFIVECKASRVESDFSATFRSFMKPKVFGLVRLEKRAGSIPLVMFYSTLTEEIEVWDYMKVIGHHPMKRQRLPGAPLFTIARRNLKTFCAHWVNDPQKFANLFNYETDDSLDKEIEYEDRTIY